MELELEPEPKWKKGGAGAENKPFRLRKTDTGIAEETSLYRVL